MKEMDRVEVIVEKKTYADDGVHKGMQGWICDSEFLNGTWLVNFPQCGENEDIATIGIKEEDMKQIDIMYAIVNEQIKAKFDRVGQADTPTSEDFSEYMI